MATAKKVAASQFFKAGKLVADNATILNTVRDAAPADYQARIPIATQGNVSQVLKEMNSYTPNWDVFWNVFLGTIGRIQINNRFGFTNPLKPFKKSALEYGNQIEEVQANLITARQYDPAGANVFGREGRTPDIRTAFHTQNRENVYELNIPMNDVLRGGFIDGASIAAFFNSLLAVPTESAENDEYVLMMQLLKHYADFEGFYNVHMDGDFTGDDAAIEHNARTLARGVRSLRTKMQYYDTKYSPEGRKSGLASRARDIVLIVKSDVDAAMTVDSYAYAFNRADAQLIADNIVVVNDFPAGMEGYNAIAVDSEFFQVADTLGPLQLSSPMNPQNLSYNTFLHVWQVLSYSRFLPAVAFSTLPDTDVAAVTSTVDSVALVDADGDTAATVDAGSVTPLSCTVTGTGNPSQAVRYELRAFTGKGKGRTLPAECYVDSTGAFHAGNLNPLDRVTVSATSLANETVSATFTFTISGATAVTGVTAAPTTVSVEVKKTADVTFTVAPDDATDKTVEYYVTDSSVAGITVSGNTVTVTGKKAGTTTLLAVAHGTDGAPVTTTVAVTVTAPTA